jgi:hypothetical protein
MPPALIRLDKGAPWVHVSSLDIYFILQFCEVNRRPVNGTIMENPTERFDDPISGFPYHCFITKLIADHRSPITDHTSSIGLVASFDIPWKPIWIKLYQCTELIIVPKHPRNNKKKRWNRK